MTLLKFKREMLSSRSRERTFNWVDKIDQQGAKLICDGAKKQSIAN